MNHKLAWHEDPDNPYFQRALNNHIPVTTDYKAGNGTGIALSDEEWFTIMDVLYKASIQTNFGALMREYRRIAAKIAEQVKT